MGLTTEELTYDQSATWTDQDGDGIRVSSNFKNLSTHSISVETHYASIEHDVSHLAEGLALLQEIDTDLKRPPFLLLVHGDVTAGRVVCERLNIKYDTPLPKNKGFRHAVCQLSLS